MPARFEDAPELQPYLGALMENVKAHRILASFRIRPVWRHDEFPAKSKGRAVWASVRVLSGLAEHLATADAVLVVESSIWERLDDSARWALLDHELTHLTVGESGLAVIGHDLEEFEDVLARRGLWRDSLKRAAPLFAARSIFGEGWTVREGAAPVGRAPAGAAAEDDAPYLPREDDDAASAPDPEPLDPAGHLYEAPDDDAAAMALQGPDPFSPVCLAQAVGALVQAQGFEAADDAGWVRELQEQHPDKPLAAEIRACVRHWAPRDGPAGPGAKASWRRRVSLWVRRGTTAPVAR